MSKCSIIIKNPDGGLITLPAPGLSLKDGISITDIAKLILENLENWSNFILTIDVNKNKANTFDIITPKLAIINNETILPNLTSSEAFPDEENIDGSYQIYNIASSRHMALDLGSRLYKYGNSKPFIVCNLNNPIERTRVLHYIQIMYKINPSLMTDKTTEILSMDLDSNKQLINNFRNIGIRISDSKRLSNQLQKSDKIEEQLKLFEKQLLDYQLNLSYLLENNKPKKDIESILKKILKLLKKLEGLKIDYQKLLSEIENIKTTKGILSDPFLDQKGVLDISGLIKFYLEHKSLFIDTTLSILKPLIDNIIHELMGWDIKEYHYSDNNANLIAEHTKFNSRLGKYTMDLGTAFSVAYGIAVNLQEAVDKEKIKMPQHEITMLSEIVKLYNLYSATDNADLTKSEELTKNISDWYDLLLSYIQDPAFTLSSPSLLKNKKGILFKLGYKTLEDVYGLSMDIRELPNLVETYHGYNIYFYENRFFVDRFVLNRKSYGTSMYSKEDAISKIDSYLLYHPIVLDSISAFHMKRPGDLYLFSPTYINEGRIVRIKDTSGLKIKWNNIDLYKFLFNNSSLNNIRKVKESIKDGYKLTDELVDKLESAEDILLFYGYMSSHNNASAESAIDDISSITAFKYYQVQLTTPAGKSNGNYGSVKYVDENDQPLPIYKLVLKPLKPTSIDKGDVSVKNQFAETVDGLKNLADAINIQFGRTGENEQDKLVIVDSFDNLTEEYKLKIDHNVHSCIVNGVIYVNSSIATEKDMLHEYAHLVLGIIRCRNEANYVQLIDKLTSSKNALQKIAMLRNIDLYKDRSDLDLKEEYVADLIGSYAFGNNIDDNIIKELKDSNISLEILDSAKLLLSGKEVTAEILDYKISDIVKLFKVLGNQIGSYKKYDSDFETSKRNRRISNFIQNGILRFNNNNTAPIGENEIRIEEKCK